MPPSLYVVLFRSQIIENPLSGGVEELEKQLTKEGKAPISRSLYDKVLANTGTRQSSTRQQNGRGGPQNQGIKYTDDETASSSKERPKYKTIQRER